jgi:hypothetical protein
MSVAAATGAVSTHQHQQPTAEQIRLAQLIDDKKHDQPEVQDIVRKVLDVVANSTQEDALLALFDCDYDYEKAVALLIEKGHDIASEWRTATNHKVTKKQQQQKSAATKNGFGGENDENGQQRGNDGSTHRGKSRVGRSRFQHQQNGGDFQNNNNQQQQNDNNYNPQQRQRGGSSYRGRNRGSYRGGSRGNDRNHQQYEQQTQDSNLDTSSPSDTTQRFTDVPYTNRRGGGGGGRQQQQQQWDVGNWNGETLIYSRSAKDDEQSSNSDNNNMSHTINGPPGETSNVNNVSELNTQQKLKSEFDPIEAARQIKNVIGIGQSQQQQQQSNAPPPKPLMDIKPLMGNQQIGQQQKSNIIQSKSIGQNLSTKVTPPPPRIPHQPVIFSDRFDGGMHKIDVQFGNLGESLEDTSSQNVSVPIASTSSAFYQHSQPITSVTKQNTMLSSVQNSQRLATTTIPHHSTEQSPFVSLSAHTHSTRPSEQQQQPVMNQQRVLPPHMQQQQPQQPSMTMKNVVPPQYAVHHQQHQMNAQNLLLQSLLYHAHPQESVQLDTSYDPAAFQLPSLDFNTPYFMAPTLNQQPQQPQTQQRYLVSQQPLPPQQQQQPQSQQQQQQQTASNRQPSSTNVQTATTSSSVPSSSTSTTSSTAPKKGPAVPPGMFLSTAPPTQPAYSNAYSTTYGVPPSVGGQQQPGATTYSTPYDPEHLFTNAFMQLANAQAQSPSGTYGSITPPVQQQNQQQQTHNNNDNKTMNYRAPFNENLVLLQQYQQYAIQQSNSQQQGQQATAHSSAPLSYFLGHPASGPSYSPGPPIMFAQPTTAMTQQQQQQTAKQQGQQYNQNNPSAGIGGNDDYYGRASSSSSSNKEAQYIYTVPTQPQQVPPQSVGQHQGVNKQQRGSGNVYNNQQNQQRPFQ